MGKYGLPISKAMDSGYASALSDTAKHIGYDMGRKVYDAKVKKAETENVAASKRAENSANQARTERKKPAPSRAEGTGKVHFDRKGRTFSETQETGLKTMELLSQALGNEFYVFESYEKNGTRMYLDENGEERHAPNGYYDPSTGAIHVDLNAGAGGEGTVLFTLAHELTHFIRDWSATKFDALAEAVLQMAYNEKDINVTDRIQEQIAKAERSGRELSEEEAYEEMIADSMEGILQDGEVVRQLMDEVKRQDATLWEKIVQWFQDLAEDIRRLVDAYKGKDPDSYEGRAVASMKDMLPVLEGFYSDALQTAGENFREAEKSTTREGSLKMQIRSVNGNDVVWIEDNIMKENKGEPTHQFIANYIAEHIGEMYTIIESGQKVYIGKDLPGEYTQSGYTKTILKNNTKILKAKNRAAANLGEMIEISANRRWEKTKHPNSKDAQYGMYRYDTRFGFPTIDSNGNVMHANVYNAELLIRNASDGKKYLYDIVNIKKDTAASALMTEKVTRAVAYATAPKGDVSIGSIRNSEPDVKDKFSLRDPVEYTKNLVALHNLTEEKLLKSLKLGGFPMPSIAITKADIPHTNFGDITLVFGRESIDPKADKRNVVYSADAWTPTVPGVEYEADSNVSDRVYNRINDLSGQVAEYFRRDLNKIRYGIEDRLNREGGEEGLVKSLSNNYALKAAYLEEHGKHIEQHTKQVENKVNEISSEMEDKLLDVWKVLGKATTEELVKIPLKTLRDQHGAELEKAYPGSTKSAIRLSNVIRKLISYLRGEANTVETITVSDAEAMIKAVDDAIDQEAYEGWVKELFGGIEKSSGIYNGKERYTPAGNLRSFKATHVPATLDGIVQAMRSQNGGSTKNVSGFNGIKTLRAGTADRLRSVDAMHSADGRLQNLTEEQFDKIHNELQDRLYDIIKTIDQEGGNSGGSNSLIRYDSIGETLMEISESGKYNVSDIQDTFHKYGKDLTDDTAMEIKKLLYDVTQMPVNLFEAKPERAVGFDEVKAAILPNGISQIVVDALQEKGVPVHFYEEGNNSQRLELVNGLENVKFSTRDPLQVDAAKNLERENEELKKDVDRLKELVKLQKQVTHGTVFSQNSIENAARKLKKAADAKGDTRELAGLLSDLYNYIAKGKELTWEDVREVAAPAVDWLWKNKQSHIDPFAEDVVNAMKGRKITLSEAQRGEVISAFGSVREFMSRIKGTVVISAIGTEGAMDLDSFWQEMSASFPDVFPESTVDADMPVSFGVRTGSRFPHGERGLKCITVIAAIGEIHMIRTG